MKDLHSHYLFNVDDGSRSFDETKKMLDNAKKNNITDIVFTPHYINETSYVNGYKDNNKIFKEIKKYADSLNINVYLGNEVFISNNILDLYKEKKITTINNSKYMLIEIPMNSKINDVKSIFFNLISNGIIPILAHPERYIVYYKDIEFFKELKTIGVLFQMNFPSLFGLYGKHAKYMSKKFLKLHMIDFIGSDIHHVDDRYSTSSKFEKKLIKLVGYEEAKKILEDNFTKVINDEKIE